tara:strand:+ start:413 stop:1414 length:1002 start_codon:yes stop_codon:yes gene_type:complete
MILICYGTRPEYIKVKPLIEKMKGVVPFQILHVAQHQDLVDGEYDHFVQIEDGKNRLDSIISSVMNSFDFQENEISHVLVQGDTATAYAMAVTAFNHRIPVIHLEAGMRTYDLENPYPEEVYRQCISRIASIHFAPTSYESHLLKQEKVNGDVYVVGNTVLDNLLGVSSEYGNVVLLTMHRRENHHLIPEYFKLFSKLAKDNPDLQFVLPLHPNPNVQKHKDLLDGILVIDPLPYDSMISSISKCRLIISDSGGIQEEAAFFKKKIIVCRETTERVASINTSSFMCKSPHELEKIFYDIKDDYIVEKDCPYGDGHSSEKIVDILQKEYRTWKA